mgnify:CR=1 FL=1
MQPSRNFDDLKFSSIHRRILLWGSGGPFLDGYVLVMIGVALEQLTPALKLDADWIGLLGAGTLAGLIVGTSLFGYISDKVGRRKMFLIDIIAIGVISVATMFVSSPVELLVMRVLIGIVIGIVAQTTRSCQFELTDHKICYKISDDEKCNYTDHKINNVSAQTGFNRHWNSCNKLKVSERMYSQMNDS